MINQIMRHGIISLILLSVGIILYFILNYLLNLPGSKKIDRIYETDEEKLEERRLKKKVFKIYIIILLWIVIATNLLIYYIW